MQLRADFTEPTKGMGGRMYVEAYDRCVAEEKGRVYTAPPEDCRKQKCDGRCHKRHAKDVPLESILTGPFQMMPADEVEETGSASQPHGGGWRIRKQSCSAGVPVLVVLVVVRAPRCCCDPPVYFAMRRTPGGLGHLVEGYAPLWGGDFVMGTGPWWLELHLVGSACYSRPMCAPAACATGVCQTGPAVCSV